MSGARVDTSRWNLFRAGAWSAGIAVAAMACGPVIGSPQGETDDPTGETDPSGPTDPSDPTIDPTQGECSDSQDCPYGYDCVNNFCEYNCYCGCGSQPPPPGSQLRCSEGPGYECYSDSDCGPEEICNDYGSCDPVPDACAGIPIAPTTIELVFNSRSDAPVESLQFADVSPEPGAELLVARDATIERVVGEASGEIVVHTQSSLVAFATGDLDGDGVVDIVTAEDDGSIRFWWGSKGGFVDSGLVQSLVGVRALFVEDRDGDGARDLYAVAHRDLFVFPTVEGTPLGDGVRLLEEQVDALAVFDAKSDGEAEVLFADGPIFSVYRELQSPTPEPIHQTIEEVLGSLVVGDYDGNGEPDAVGFTASEQVTFVGEIATWPALTEVANAPTSAAAGDIDGDGRADLARLERSGGITVRYGSHAGIPKGLVPPFRCDSQYTIDGAADQIAAGDTDGDGRAELAVADGARVTLVRF
jgi:hypothetical protein